MAAVIRRRAVGWPAYPRRPKALYVRTLVPKAIAGSDSGIVATWGPLCQLSLSCQAGMHAL